MSPNKTLYIREEDVPTWEKAEQFASKARQSLSVVVAAALRAYIPPAPADDELQEIKVEVGPQRNRTEAFLGRWLVEPDDDSRPHGDKYDAGACFGVALTKRGQIAVYSYHVADMWPAVLSVYATLDDAEADDVPADILADAAATLGQERLIWRDI